MGPFRWLPSVSHDVTTQRLSRERILDAAKLLSAEGRLHTLSMRSLAELMGVTPMALYRHVIDKDDIMLEVTNELLQQQQLPSSDSQWDDYLRSLALLLRAMVIEEPAILGLYARRPVTVPAARARLDAAVSVLTNAGLTEEAAIRAYATVHTYTLGFCALEFARHEARDGIEVVQLDPRAAQIEGFVSETQFEQGLETILEGIRVFRAPPQSPNR